MNCRTGAVTQYGLSGFNSACEFQGKTLLAGDNGVVVLGGDTDAGAPINGVVRTGLHSFDAAVLKRPRDVRVHGRLDGAMRLTITRDDTGEAYEYTLPRGPQDLRTRRFVPGKGIRAGVLRYQIESISGDRFSITELDIDADVLARRVG